MPINNLLRPAQKSDQQSLAALLSAKNYLHKHLDWRPPLDWLGQQPFYLWESDQNILAALALPPDPPCTAWVRLYAVQAGLNPAKIWGLLFEKALESLKKPPRPVIAALATRDWFASVLVQNNFRHYHNIVVLARSGNPPPVRPQPAEWLIRPLLDEDLQDVVAVDHQAFESIWQISPDAAWRASLLPSYCTVIEREGHICGYQISTLLVESAHLARLAVHPALQGQGLGYHLLQDLLFRLKDLGIERVTVNTQQDNRASLRLYRKIGFEPTGESFPVYRYKD